MNKINLSRKLLPLAAFIFSTNVLAGSGGAPAGPVTQFNFYGLYSPGSKTFLSFKQINKIGLKERYAMWEKRHYSQVQFHPNVADESISFQLIDDNDNNNCISNNDTVAISDIATGAFLGGYNYGYFPGQHIIQHRLYKNPSEIPTYKIVDLDRACIGNNGQGNFKLKANVDLVKTYYWNNTTYTYTATGDTLSDPLNNTSFQLIGNSAATNQLSIDQLNTQTNNEEVTLLSQQSSFISADGQAYLPTINGAGEKWEILGIDNSQVLRHYCIPDGAHVLLKNHASKKFLRQTGWTFGVDWTGTEFVMKNREYPGACIAPTDGFSLMLPNGDFIQTNPGHHLMDHYQPYNADTMTFAYARNPDVDFQLNKANLTFEIYDPEEKYFYMLPSHEDNSMNVNGAGTGAYPIKSSTLADHPAGVAFQYTFHSDKNSFCDNSSFFLKRQGAVNDNKFFGSTTEGSLSAAKIRTDRPHVLAWESFRFDFTGDDEGQCYSPEEIREYYVDSKGMLMYTPKGYKRDTHHNNQIRMWDPEGDTLGYLDDYFYPFNADSFIQAADEDLVDLRFYFGSAEGGQNYRTELAVTGLKANDGQFVSAVNEGGEDVNAAGQVLNIWESLTFEPLNRTEGACLGNGSKVFIRTNNGHLIKANAGDISVDSNSFNRLTWETFTIKKLNGGGCLKHGDKIELDTYHGTHLRASGGALFHDNVYVNDDYIFTLLLNNSIPN